MAFQGLNRPSNMANPTQLHYPIYTFPIAAHPSNSIFKLFVSSDQIKISTKVADIKSPASINLPMAQQKVVLKVLTMTDDKTKQKAMEAAADIHGVDSIAADVKDQKLTVIGVMDAVAVVKKLAKKVGKVDLISVGPAKEVKKEEPKKDEQPKKEEPKKDEPKK